MSETGAVPFEQKAQSSPSIVAIVVFSRSSEKVTHCYLSFWLYEGRLAGSETDLSPMETSTLPRTHFLITYQLF